METNPSGGTFRVIFFRFAKVQIRPWNLSDSDFVMDGSQPLDPRKTIFVGGVPRPLRAGNSRTFGPPDREAPSTPAQAAANTDMLLTRDVLVAFPKRTKMGLNGINCGFLAYKTSEVDVAARGWRGACRLEAKSCLCSCFQDLGQAVVTLRIDGVTEGSTFLFLG